MTTLNYDAQGFILGLRRLENNTQQIHNDTQEIIRVLMAQHQIGEARLQEMNDTLQRINQNLNRLPPTISPDTVRDYNPNQNPPNPNRQNPPPRDVSNRLRDSNRRFTRQSEDSKQAKALADNIGNSVGESLKIDDKNLDPLIDSYHEVKDALAPITSIFGALSDKVKERKQRKHDKAVEDSLEDIADNTRNDHGGGGGGGGAGGLLGLLGKGGKALLKGGGKRLGILGALFGAGSLASDWGGLDTEGKSKGVGSLAGGVGGAMAGATTGAVIGSIVPVVGTAVGGVVGGVVGGWLGSEGGEALGKTASPYIKDWTQGMSNANTPKKISDNFASGLEPFFRGAKGIWDWVKDKSSSIMGTSGGKGADSSASGGSGGSGGFENTSGSYSGDSDSLLSQIKSKGLVKATSIDGGKAHAGTYAAALNMTDLFKDKVTGFAAFDDKFHLSKGGYHPKGLAFDMSVKGGKVGQVTPEVAQMKEYLASLGMTEGSDFAILDEYLKLSKNATGGHIHFSWKSQEAAEKYYNQQLKKSDTNASSPATQANSGGTPSTAGGQIHQQAYESSGIKYFKYGEASSADLVKRGSQKIDKDAATAYDKMAADFKAATGMNLGVQSGYRSVEYQQGIIDRKRKAGQSWKEIYSVSAPAGHSEHQTGEGMDFNMNGNANLTNTGEWADNAKGYKWLQSNARKYGYSQSYQKGNALGTAQENWHWKYSGSEKARRLLTPVGATAIPLKSASGSSLPVSKKPAIPPTPKADIKPLNTNKPKNIQANNQGGIPQNVSDQGIAYAVTGGLGEDRWWG